MTSFDKIIVTFLSVLALLPVVATLLRYVRQGNFEPLPHRFWVPWSNVLMLSLLALVRNHPIFYHAHMVFVLTVFLLWLLVLVCDFWKARRNHDMNVTAIERKR